MPVNNETLEQTEDYQRVLISYFIHDRVGIEDRIGDEEISLYNYLNMMKNLKEERELEKLTNNIARCSIMWLEVE